MAELTPTGGLPDLFKPAEAIAHGIAIATAAELAGIDPALETFSYPGHPGRPGHRGGSLPRGTPSPNAPETKANLQRGTKAMWGVLSDQKDAIAPLSRPEIGPTDLVYDRSGMGVKHILIRREEQNRRHPGRNKLTPEETCLKAVEVYSLGSITDRRGDRFIIQHHGYTVLVAKGTKANAWIMNAYENWEDSRGKGGR